MKVVIFAGGVGSRLWPLSRKNSPKQFEKIVGKDSTLQLAAKRLLPDFKWDDLYISTGAKYTSIVKKQLPEIPASQIIGEPEMRDVGPAVGLITAILEKKFPDEPMAILWSDHLVKKEELFRKTLKEAEKIISRDPEKIIFIGQTPRFANQNIGWIECGEKIITYGQTGIFKLKNFLYRPELEIAKEFLQSGHHVWNLGYFVTTPKFLWNLFKRFSPKLYEELAKIQKNYGRDNFLRTLEEIYPQIEKINFDNVILEKIDPEYGLVISEDLGWSDVGAWEALKESLQNDPEDNVVSGKVLLKDCTDCLVYNFTDQLLTVIDQKSQLIIGTNDAVLVCDKNSVPKIKKVVEELAQTENSHLI